MTEITRGKVQRESSFEPASLAPKAGARPTVDAKTVQSTIDDLLAQAGLTRKADGTFGVRDAAESQKASDASKSTPGTDAGADMRLPPPAPPKVEFTPELRQGAESFAANLDDVFNDFLQKPGSTTVDGTTSSTEGTTFPESQLRQFSELSPELLLAAFLKLNINDPNNSVETHNALHTLMSDLRQQGIKNAQQQEKVAMQEMREAQAYADKMGVVGKVLTAVMLVVSVVASVFTFGAAGLIAVAICAALGGVIAGATGGDVLNGIAMGAAVGGIVGSVVSAAAGAAQATAKAAADQAKTAAQEAAKKAMKEAQAKLVRIISTLINMAAGLTKATGEYEAAKKLNAAQESQVDAQKYRMLVEMLQDMVEQQGEVIRLIMESKNAAVDSVIKMMQAAFSTNQKLIAVSLSR